MLLLTWCSLPTTAWLATVVETTTKINDREIFWLHEFSSHSNQSLTISLGLITENHYMKLLGTTVRQTNVLLHIWHYLGSLHHNYSLEGDVEYKQAQSVVTQGQESPVDTMPVPGNS